MGAMTDAMIAGWQKEHGIEPPTDERCEILTEMSNIALDLIKVIELEKSGIRHGDGRWYGGDPVDEITQLLRDLSDQLYKV